MQIKHGPSGDLAHPAISHGGNLSDAVSRFGRPRHEWLDLSTGINPHPYPAPAPGPDAWHRLPEHCQPLIQAAQSYYHAQAILPIAGTQAAIQTLPQYRMHAHGAARVTVSAPSYAEHAHRWTQAGHTVIQTEFEHLNKAAGQSDVMVICNPNNPTGASIAPEQLLTWQRRLAPRKGWLIVDEAFADTAPNASIASFADRPGLIVLRSIGKFFGLAGLRLGFIAADEAFLTALAEYLGPWTVSGPAQQIGCAALNDKAWQLAAKEKLATAGARLRGLLKRHHIASTGVDLFQWWPLPAQQAEDFWLHMAQRGIWVRLFAAGATGIRVGLPADESGWQRLMVALGEWNAQTEPA
ncbi:MAG: threonine-phosphate decarboxylase [Herbaspirillum sp.]|jgi:cobalamin biosynthetic protein CobC|nr:threonine-phosphate decarboxylase [Herbaspirillum sp.]